jgi:bifunctional pyridoxal-dependent enzyme with beta-cystathionase and maltose regulon repressor activities
MSEHHKYAVDFLKKHHIPYYKNTVAAFFIWIDLLSPYARKLETSQTSSKSDLDGTMSALSLEEKQAIEMSKEITAKLMAQKVFCAAGESYGTEKPGWFRIIFTQPRPVLEEGLNRIAKALDLE